MVCTLAEKHISMESKPKVGWNVWLGQHASRLLLFARQQARSFEDAEDILQDALVKLAQKVADGTFQGDEENWAPYVYTTIRRLAIDTGRQQDRRKVREEKAHDDVEDGFTPHEATDKHWFTSAGEDSETQELLEEELKKLPEKFAEVIHLKIWGDLTFQQISETLGISINTVASRYRYGLDYLKKALQKHYDTQSL